MGMQPSELYLELANHYDQRGEAQSRDRFLVLAADAAMTAGDATEAEQLRQRLLSLNPHHLLKPFRSFEEALKSRDVTDYINALRRRHPTDQVAGLVQSTTRAAPQPAAASEPKPHLHVPPPQPEPKPHLHVPPPQPVKVEPAPRPVEVYRMRPPDEPPPTTVRPRAVPPPPPLPNLPAKTARPRPVVESKALPPLPVAAEASRPRTPSPFRPEPLPLPRPSVPVYQGIRLAPTPGAWLCSVLFFVLLVGGLGLTALALGRVFLPADLVNFTFLPNRE
jgi:hypothetical protein